MDFSIGQLVETRGINAQRQEDFEFSEFVFASLKRHIDCDWGEVDKGDCDSNNKALINSGRILSAYSFNGIKIWIITEADRSATTVLFPSEY